MVYHGKIIFNMVNKYIVFTMHSKSQFHLVYDVLYEMERVHAVKLCLVDLTFCSSDMKTVMMY